MKLARIIGLFTVIPSIALAVNSKPLQLVEAWAKAVKERDGKKQYQLLCPTQQEKNYASLKALNWVTGISSPQVGDYKIVKLKQKSQGKTEFLVKYRIILNSKPIGTVSDRLQVVKGCIAKFKYLSPSGEEPSKKE